MIKTKLIPMSRATAEGMDSVTEAKRMHGNGQAIQILLEAQNCWFAMHRFREDRQRNKRYCYGDQWKDTIKVDGEAMSEEHYIKTQGNIPLKNNLIRRLVRNVLGVFRSQSKEPTCTARDRDEQKLGETMSTVLQYNMQRNRMNEVNARSMEEFLISGFIVHRKSASWRNNTFDVWTDYVQPDNFFVDNCMRDFRGWDVSMVGEIHDVSFNELCTQFAETPQDYQHLAEIYRAAKESEQLSTFYEQFGYYHDRRFDFLMPTDPSRCRVIEVWKKESKPRYQCHDYNTGELFKVDVDRYAEEVEAVNQARIAQARAEGMDEGEVPLIVAKWFMDSYWYYYFLSPFGDILAEGETPYKHQGHPYVFKAYPFIDGEIHSFVADVIDQQRYVNHLITMEDWIIRASAKGVLLFPEDCLPKGMDISDIADEWSRFNGVIAIKKGAQMLPQQVANNSTNIGIQDILNLQLKFFEDISGVNGALQGKPGYAGTSGNLYAQQTQNATTSLLDLLESFSDFVIEAAYMDVKNIQQYYTQKRVFNISGRAGARIEFDPSKINNVEFDLSIQESSSTPAYRMMANDFLMQIWQAGQISLEQLLENGNFPFADQLLQSIQSQKEELQQGKQPQGLSPQLQQQVMNTANQGNVNKAYQMMHGGEG